VEVIFLPPNTTSLIQPLDQGVIATFKPYYTRRTFKRILDAIGENATLDVTTCWKKFTIADCITDIRESLHEIKQSIINGCWWKLWPEVVHETAVIPSIKDYLQDIAQIAHHVGEEGFEDMQPHELEEMTESHTEEMTEEDLEELINEDDSEDEEEVITRFTLNPKGLTEIMKLQRALIDKVMECDPVMERCLKFKREIENASCPYLEIQKKLQKTAKQMTITRFFQRKPCVSASPNPPLSPPL
jgi:hypothetical protein